MLSYIILWKLKRICPFCNVSTKPSKHVSFCSNPLCSIIKKQSDSVNANIKIVLSFKIHLFKVGNSLWTFPNRCQEVHVQLYISSLHSRIHHELYRIKSIIFLLKAYSLKKNISLNRSIFMKENHVQCSHLKVRK